MSDQFDFYKDVAPESGEEKLDLDSAEAVTESEIVPSVGAVDGSLRADGGGLGVSLGGGGDAASGSVSVVPAGSVAGSGSVLVAGSGSAGGSGGPASAVDSGETESVEEIETPPVLLKVDDGLLDFTVDEDDLDDEEEESSAKGRLSENSDKMLSGILASTEDEDVSRRNRQAYLFTSAKPELFQNENHLIYRILYHFRDRNIQITDDFIKIYLLGNRKLLRETYKYTGLPKRPTPEEETELIASTVKKFKELSRPSKAISDSEMRLALETYLLDYEAIQGQKILSDAMDILVEGKDGYSGFEDSSSYVMRETAKVSGLLNANEGSGFQSMRDFLLEAPEESENYLITDFGDIEELNEYVGGIYSGDIVTVVGPTKGGKTRFSASLCHRILTNSKLPVSVWPVEGGKEAWAAMMRAIHFDYLHNREEIDISKHQTGITDSVILRGNYPSPALKEMEMASMRELATNLDYGNLDFIDRPFHPDTFIDEIDASVKSNGSSIVIVDYLSLLNKAGETKQSVIERSYQQLSQYVKKNNVTVLSPAQYRQEDIRSMSKNGPNEEELRAAIAGSGEIMKSSDMVLAIWASTEDLLNNKITFRSLPSRRVKPFPDFDVYADMGTCYFSSMHN